MSKVLFVEPPTESTAVLLDCFQKILHWKVIHVPTLAGPMLITERYDDLKVVIITLGSNPSEASRLIRDLRESATLGGVILPYVVVLSPFKQRPDLAARFERLGSVYLLRAYPDQIVEVVKKLEWQDRAYGGRATLIIRRTAGHVAETAVQVGSLRIPLRLGPRLRALIEHLAVNSRTEHSTEMLADTLGIQAQSLKEYLLRLRRVLDDAFAEACVAIRGEDVVWTKQFPGGFLHGLHANVEMEDALFSREEQVQQNAEAKPVQRSRLLPKMGRTGSSM